MRSRCSLVSLLLLLVVVGLWGHLYQWSQTECVLLCVAVSIRCYVLRLRFVTVFGACSSPCGFRATVYHPVVARPQPCLQSWLQGAALLWIHSAPLVCGFAVYGFSCPPRPKTIKRKVPEVSSSWVVNRALVWVAWCSLSLCCPPTVVRPPAPAPCAPDIQSWALSQFSVPDHWSRRPSSWRAVRRLMVASRWVLLPTPFTSLLTWDEGWERTVSYFKRRRPRLYNFYHSILLRQFYQLLLVISLLLWLTCKLNVVIGTFIPEAT